LRPELTAPIARAACTRLSSHPRPLRLWSEGTIFRSFPGDFPPRIQEQLQSGVELLGDPSAAADTELLGLLLAAAGRVGLTGIHQPRLLLGHHGLLSLLLERLPVEQRQPARAALCSLDAISLTNLPLPDTERTWLESLSRLRGEPPEVLNLLREWLGEHPLLHQLTTTLNLVIPLAASQGVSIQLDPTFQPHFALYDGLVLKLVCQGSNAPVEIVSGGRYDALVGRFWAGSSDQPADQPALATGVGFGFDIDALRELPNLSEPGERPVPRQLVAFRADVGLAAALDVLGACHRRGEVAELHGQPVEHRAEAEALAAARGCSGCIFLQESPS
jgi:ATP phosphoribosyltransferase regulatory subunit